MILTGELSQGDQEVEWLKDNVPLSISEGKYEAVNQDCTYQLVIANVSVEDAGEYTVQAGEVQSTALVVVNGQCHFPSVPFWFHYSDMFQPNYSCLEICIFVWLCWKFSLRTVEGHKLCALFVCCSQNLMK